ncbi:MAG: DNA primase regulatory subunit PriL [Methanobacteriota archaeon]|nr:MAG: DNA primase regulatory subunit PriL [Euryarchaeota archaeon]TLZ90434.1 MAG: DNA primase regulatory subunit PriL [Euryarchaeota archaeon]
MSRRLVSEHGLHHRVGHPRSALQSFGPGARGRAFRRTHRHGIRFSRFAVPRVGLLWPRDVPSEVELATLAKYPFLRESSAFIRAEKVSLEEILLEPAFARARSLGKARVLEALERGAASDRVAIAPADQLAQLLAYPVARIFVSALEDTYLIRRFALREAIAAEGRLESESDDFVIHMASQLAMDLRREDGGFRLHFTDFLRFTNTMRDAPWKLINQRVDRGYVTLQRAKALRVMRNAIQRHIEEGLPLPVNDDIVSAFRADLREIRGILEAKKATFKAEDIGKVSITRFPPCMYNLLAQIQNHENVPHMGRFAIVAFLHHIGLGNEEIFRVFGDVPDFAADVTKYQIEHITGTSSPTEYTPPECATMKSYGICPGPDRICLTIKHPLQYYRVKGREQRPRGESASTAT